VRKGGGRGGRGGGGFSDSLGKLMLKLRIRDFLKSTSFRGAPIPESKEKNYWTGTANTTKQGVIQRGG